MYFEISKNTEPSNWKSEWSFWEEKPETTKIQVGKTKPELSEQLPLEDGDYKALVQYIEATRFGSMKISRKTTRIVDFKIGAR